MQRYEIKSPEVLYNEWIDSGEAVSARTKTLVTFLERVNAEREQAFMAGYKCISEEMKEMLESFPDKIKS